MLNNIFNQLSGAFTTISLTAAINETPRVPSRIASLGLFEEAGVSTTSIAVESEGGILTLIPDTQRNAPPNQFRDSKRRVRDFRTSHFPLEDVVMASEIQDIREFGQANALKTVQSQVNRKLAAMSASHDATLEFQRIGALKGTILDSDNSTVIYNLFTEFGITQTSIDFDLGTSGTKMKTKVLAVKRSVEDTLGVLSYQRMHAFCGKAWFDKFVTHPDVEKAYDRYQESAFLRADQRTGFEFAGMVFEEYNGKVGSIPFVPDNEVIAFPVGVPGLFITRFAPANFVETVNTIGLPRYAKTERMEYDRGLKLLTESNPISLCTRPKVLIKLTSSTGL